MSDRPAGTEEFDSLTAAALYINSTQDLPTMCRHMLEAGCRVLASEAASLMISDTAGLHWLAALGAAGPVVIDQMLQPGEGIAGWVAQSGQSVMTNEPAADSRFSRRIDALSGFVTNALLCVPMVAHGKIHGVLEFLNTSPEKRFGEHDVRKALAFSSLCAVALENNRLIRLAEEIGNLREIGRFKNEMVAAVAHELRNPLTAVLGFSEMTLTDESIDVETARKFAERVHTEAVRMRRLIDDFLNLSRLESGSILIVEEPVKLHEVLVGDRDKFAALSPRHALTLSHGEHYTVLGDRERVSQILDNLVGNAIKYSPDGGAIELSARRDGACCTVSVQNHGLGIPPDSMNRLFHHFYRVPGARHMQQRGTGLGLTVVKTLVDKMGGKVGVESIAGQGTRFWFSLPLAD